MYLFGNFFAGVLIFRAQFFFGIVFVEVFKAESEKSLKKWVCSYLL